MTDEILNSREAREYLDIPKKNFENYFKYSKEIKAFKKRGRWWFKKLDLDVWNKLRKERTVTLTLAEYEECFEFAIKMAYSGLTKYGIRGTRSEVQLVDDVILGILVEMALQKFLKEKLNYEIVLDMDIHTGIVPQDIVAIVKDGKKTKPKLKVGVKGSKSKSCFLVLKENEYLREDRKSDLYIFGRVLLPSDHLFRILRDHSFFKKARKILERWNKEYPKDKKYKTIGELKEVDVWICGFTEYKNLRKTTEIPGQKFDGGYRYVKNVLYMNNSDEDWKKLINKL